MRNLKVRKIINTMIFLFETVASTVANQLRLHLRFRCQINSVERKRRPHV